MIASPRSHEFSHPMRAACRALLLLGLTTGCHVEWGAPGTRAATTSTDDIPAGEVWIYTSMYQSVIDDLEPRLRQALPGVEPRWYQAGSEKVAQRVEAEWDAGGSKACLLLTSDPFWYASIASKGRLATHFAPNVLRMDRSLVDPDGLWATARLSLLVLGVHEGVNAEDLPGSLSELTQETFRDRVSMGDPLSSGTMFTLLSFWSQEPGWSFVEELRAHGMVAAGGNSSVLTRIETREREIGILLLENLLKASEKGSPARAVYPADGAIAVPGPIALTADCRNPVAARAVYDFILSDIGQQAMVDGYMYAALPHLPPPEGARPLEEVALRPWSAQFRDEVSETKAQIKERFATLMASPR